MFSLCGCQYANSVWTSLLLTLTAAGLLARSIVYIYTTWRSLLEPISDATVLDHFGGFHFSPFPFSPFPISPFLFSPFPISPIPFFPIPDFPNSFFPHSRFPQFHFSPFHFSPKTDFIFLVLRGWFLRKNIIFDDEKISSSPRRCDWWAQNLSTTNFKKSNLPKMEFGKSYRGNVIY